MVDRGLFDQKYHVALLGNSVVPTQSPNYTQRQVLDPSFQPSNWDVICHNSKEVQDHVGNKRFKICVENHLNSYMNAPSRIAKSAIITNLVSSIRESSTQPGGGFVRYDESAGRWYEVGEKIARDKVGQALRDAARQRKAKKKSSSSSKSSKKSISDSITGAHQVVSTMDIDMMTKVKQEPQHHLVPQIKEEDSAAKLPPLEPKKTNLPKNKVLLPLSKNCFHFIHDTSSVSATISSSSHGQPPGQPSMEPSNTSAADGGSARLLEESNVNSRSDVPAMETADELLQWFVHDEDIL